MPKQANHTSPDSLARQLQAYLAERHKQIGQIGADDRTADGRRFGWCGEVLDFLVEGAAERMAGRGITFTNPLPGPFRLWDEDQQPDGEHVRRFWTTALLHGCPIAKLCTVFFHRHDRPALPRPPQVLACPPDHREEGAADLG
jgi:hypothetical protein